MTKLVSEFKKTTANYEKTKAKAENIINESNIGDTSESFNITIISNS